jgi:hypothetical protein
MPDTLSAPSDAALDQFNVVNDPIFARLAEWRAALAAFDACDEAKDPEMYETLSLAEIAAQKVVYATKPTTIAGVMTLASYLAVDDNCDDACIGDLALKQGLLTIAGALADIEGKRLAAGVAPLSSQLLQIQDDLEGVRVFVRALSLAAGAIETDDADPLQALGYLVKDKLTEAIDALQAIRQPQPEKRAA